jgi:hypothetical protein
MTLLDGEIPAGERYVIESHIGECGTCTAELDELRSMASEFSAALAMTDSAAPVLRARARLQPHVAESKHAAAARTHRHMPAAALLKAAAIVLLVAGAASAAIPGTPLRRLIESIAERAATLISGPEAPAVVESPEPVFATPPAVEQRQPGNEYGIVPVGGRARVSIHEPVAGATIAVRLVDHDRVRVTAISADDTRVQSGQGWMDVFENTTGLIIEVPRDLASMTVEVDGRLYFVKDGDRTRTPGPGTQNRRGEFVFQAHSR